MRLESVAGVRAIRSMSHVGICSLFHPQPYSSGGRSATPAVKGPQIQTEVLPKPAFRRHADRPAMPDALRAPALAS